MELEVGSGDNTPGPWIYFASDSGSAELWAPIRGLDSISGSPNFRCGRGE